MWLITSAGREAWESGDTAVPEDYRRLLWLIDLLGGVRALESLQRQHPEHMLRDWLMELHELGFLQPMTHSLDAALDVSVELGQSALEAGSKAAAALSDAGAYLPETRRTSTGAPKPRSETLVLIVEDDPDQLALADLRVSMAGYKVKVASTAAELSRFFVDNAPPDLLLLDIMLPDGDGLNVLAKLRRHPSFSSLPVVMLTAKQEVEDIARGLALGADGYVTKPYSKNILSAVISGVLGEPAEFASQPSRR